MVTTVTARCLILSAGLALLVAHPGIDLASATPLPVVVEVQCGVTEPVCILVVPDGSGATFQEARTLAGAVVDATITLQVWLYDEEGLVGPEASYPAEYLTLEGTGVHTQGCDQDAVARADHDTDAEGWTTISAAPHAGGWSQGLLEVYLDGYPASSYDGCDCPSLPIYFNSPDLDGNLRINLSDVALFTQDYYGPNVRFRSDLVWDGVINLADLAEFSQHLGVECPYSQ